MKNGKLVRPLKHGLEKRPTPRQSEIALLRKALNQMIEKGLLTREEIVIATEEIRNMEN